MKNLYRYTFVAFIFLFVSCAKDLDFFSVNGEKMLDFQLISPASNDSLAVNLGTPNESIDFNWKATTSGLGSDVIYTIQFDKIDGDFSNPLFSKESNKNGSSNIASLTHQELHDLATSITPNGAYAKVIWTVTANNGSPNIVAAQFKHTVLISTSSNGLSKSELTFPTNNSYMLIDGNKAAEEYIFTWGKSNATDANENVKYQVLIDEVDGDFSKPVFSIPSDNSGLDNKLTKTHEEWYQLFDKKEYSKGAFKWTVRASTASISVEYPSSVFCLETTDWILPIYIVGDAISDIEGSSGWLIDQAILLNGLSPKVNAGVINFRNDRNNAEFKFFPKISSWDNGIAATENLSYIGNCEKGSNGNFVYTGDNSANVVYVNMQGKMVTVTDEIYLIGGSTVADGNMDKAIPFTYIGENTYQVFSYITTDSWGYKFLPTRSWNGGWGLTEGTTDKITQNNPKDLKVSEDGFYRVTVNFSDGTTKTEKTDWGLIGSATSGGWDTDSDMTLLPLSDNEYKGTYTWKITTDLTSGKIKFRANDGWAVNFGDTDANGSLELGGSDIEVSEAGNYTIKLVLDPAGYTYSMVKNF
ncbi:SusF/SusE family outer membrane protein [Maribellus luteus]|uniref:SusF/SusE family outer membrane protein n=1 Tax=Maribellus luteus TaxID=2305463 RepID=A0A399ST25_9BACT|nr:SusE domain-containing protein [Maribellus luteus]RIJ45662.1 SusF/SusE family outer membrane protein [Maribellus luteus]